MKLIPKNEKKILFIPKAKQTNNNTKMYVFYLGFFLVTKSK